MDWTCGVVRWLNENSSAVMAVGTVVIAWATWVSSRLVRLEKKIERANRMPILTFADEQTADHRSLYVKNVGYGPALNVVRKIIEPGDLGRSSADEPLPLGSVGPGEQVYAIRATLPPNSSVPILDDAKFHAVIECDDVVGGHYEFVLRDRAHSAPKALTNRKMPPSQTERI